jgi:hypothetical protein
MTVVMREDGKMINGMGMGFGHRRMVTVMRGVGVSIKSAGMV